MTLIYSTTSSDVDCGRSLGARARSCCVASPHRSDAAPGRTGGRDRQAPFRHMVTPGGFRMSVAMTNCGSFGWVTDRTGYRYDAIDPESGRHWPPMPDGFLRLATARRRKPDFSDFMPDACLINRYEPGTRLSLHQDKNERDFASLSSPSRSEFRRSFCSAD